MTYLVESCSKWYGQPCERQVMLRDVTDDGADVSHDVWAIEEEAIHSIAQSRWKMDQRASQKRYL